jgi:hypothetical protein
VPTFFPRWQKAYFLSNLLNFQQNLSCTQHNNFAYNKTLASEDGKISDTFFIGKARIFIDSIRINTIENNLRAFSFGKISDIYDV